MDDEASMSPISHILITVKQPKLMDQPRDLKVTQDSIRANSILKSIANPKKRHLKMNYMKVQIDKLIEAAGGKWNPNTKLRELPYKEAVALGLEHRIVTTK